MPDETLQKLAENLRTWEPDVRVLGNLRAGDILNSLTAAHARIAELEEDGKRMSWLSAQRWAEISNGDTGACVDCEAVTQCEGRTLRAAIDAARSRRGEG